MGSRVSGRFTPLRDSMVPLVEHLERDRGRLDGAHPQGDGAVVDEDQLADARSAAAARGS